MDNESSPPRIAFNLSADRVQYYSEIVEHIASDAIRKYYSKYKRMPSADQIAFLKKEITRYAVIRHDVDTASKLEISETNILIENQVDEL